MDAQRNCHGSLAGRNDCYGCMDFRRESLFPTASAQEPHVHRTGRRFKGLCIRGDGYSLSVCRMETCRLSDAGKSGFQRKIPACADPRVDALSAQRSYLVHAAQSLYGDLLVSSVGLDGGPCLGGRLRESLRRRHNRGAGRGAKNGLRTDFDRNAGTTPAAFKKSRTAAADCRKEKKK